jgi:hypothetical protein
VGDAPLDSEAVADAVALGVPLGVGDGVPLSDGVTVPLTLGVPDEVPLPLGVPDGVPLTLGVRVGEAPLKSEAVADPVRLTVWLAVPVNEGVPDPDAVGVAVEVCEEETSTRQRNKRTGNSRREVKTIFIRVRPKVRRYDDAAAHSARAPAGPRRYY